MGLWVFDNDGVLYDCTAAEQEFSAIFIAYFSRLLACSSSEVERLRTHLRKKHQTESSVFAFAQEFDLDFDEIVANTYLKIDLERCGVPHQDEERLRVLQAIPAPKVVLTNGPSVFARSVLDHIGLLGCFGEIIGIAETGFCYKPDTRAFASVERRLPGFDRYIYCDDSVMNLDAAQIFGWKTIWFCPQGAPSPSQHAVVRSFQEISSLRF